MYQVLLIADGAEIILDPSCNADQSISQAIYFARKTKKGAKIEVRKNNVTCAVISGGYL